MTPLTSRVVPVGGAWGVGRGAWGVVTAWYDSGGVEIYVGHVLDVLAGLDAESVQCVVTSPPYFGLRSYATEPQIWGGSPDCDHQLAAAPAGKVLTGGTGTASAKQVTNAGSQYGNAWVEQGERVGSPQRDHGADGGFGETRGEEPHRNGTILKQSLGATCTRCGSWRGELGSEPRADCQAWARGVEPCSSCFVCHLVTVFRAVRRVLHPTGTVFCNLGDSYSGSGKGPTGHNVIGDQGQRQGFVDQRSDVAGLGPKQLMMLPARVALALQSDGWVLRSAITWAKKSPMPESVRDRPTNATEQVYLLAKQPTYYYDAEAVRQPNTNGTIARLASGPIVGPGQGPKPQAVRGDHGPAQYDEATGANLRNFWLLGPEPYSAGHFATFPRKLVEPCVLAGTSARGCCSRCRAPWERVTGHTCEHCGTVRQANSKPCCEAANGWQDGRIARDEWLTDEHQASKAPRRPGAMGNSKQSDIGWRPTCRCEGAEVIPCTVLDCFLGSGTTAYVARHHGRRAVGIELNAEYARLAADRLKQQTLGLELY